MYSNVFGCIQEEVKIKMKPKLKIFLTFEPGLGSLCVCEGGGAAEKR